MNGKRSDRKPVLPLLFGHPFDLHEGQCYTIQSGTSNFVTSAVHETQEQQNVSWHAALDFTPPTGR